MINMGAPTSDISLLGADDLGALVPNPAGNTFVTLTTFGAIGALFGAVLGRSGSRGSAAFKGVLLGVSAPLLLALRDVYITRTLRANTNQ